MTGYGRGTCEVGGRRLVIEMRSLNHRFLEVKLRLPWADAAIDQFVVQLLRTRLDRGVVTVSAREDSGAAPQLVRADVALARGYAQALEQVRTALGIAEPVSLALVAALPGVLVAGEGTGDSEALWKALEPGVSQAAAALVEARAREGASIAADLGAHVDALEAHASALRKLTVDAPVQQQKRLLERLSRLSAEGVDPQRLAQEVAMLADRADVSEELSRLSAHLVEIRRLLDEPGPQGRRLDFLVQELNREVNTIGSKSQSAEVAARVVEAKSVIERIREQVQNVE
jgi:uncharacterized protein (TIGR00255 family)